MEIPNSETRGQDRLFENDLKKEVENDLKRGVFDRNSPPIFSGDDKVKTSQRLHYEAQVEVIKKQLGDLEKIRLTLGLSQRKMSQLLLVDPSAWTRWTRKGDPAPPHVWRALQWYMLIQEKIPGLTPQYFVGKDPEILHQQAVSLLHKNKHENIQKWQHLENKWGEEMHQLKLENASLLKRIDSVYGELERSRRIIKLSLGIGALTFLFVILRTFLIK